MTFEFAVEVEVLRYGQRVEEDIFLEAQTQIGANSFKFISIPHLTRHLTPTVRVDES